MPILLWMSFSIRPYIETDRVALLELFQENVPDYFAQHELGEFEGYLNKHSASYFTVWDGDTLLGGAGYNVEQTKQTGSITWIFFSNQRKGSGAGTQTVTHLLRVMSENYEISEFRVRTSQHAYRFFERFGFIIEKIEQDYWAAGLDLYDMGLSHNDWQRVNKNTL